MIYTTLTKKAMTLAYEAHAGQLDQGGMPYIFHPIHLAEGMRTEEGIAVALLHDVAEDTALTWADLVAADLPPAVLQALRLLTRDPLVPYLTYVANLAGNPLAREVKLADLRHNSDLTRLAQLDEKALYRNKQYHQALSLLEQDRLFC